MRKSTTIKKPWPTQAAMEQIYEMKLWGGENHTFYSGSGSHDPAIVAPYITAIQQFLQSFEKPLTVCDLGCGDFNIGSQLVAFTKQYHAVDIVPNLIDHLLQNNKSKKVNFQCLDIATDSLPKADCAIIRQVLQHLSNAEVQQVLTKLTCYKYVILTEHIPNGTFKANADIISGQGIRLKKKSGLDIAAPPFNFVAKEVIELLKIEVNAGKECMVTNLFVL